MGALTASIAHEAVARLRTLFSRREITAETLDLNEAAREVIALSLTEWQSNRVVLRQELADAMTTVDDRPRELLIRTEREGNDGVRLSVKDAGVGFDPQLAARLFEGF